MTPNPPTPPRDDAPELLPCPFCGGKADWSFGTYGDGAIWRHIACVSCDAMGPAVARANWTDVEAVAGWNRRASLATPAPDAGTVDQIAQIIRDNLSGPMFDEPHIQASHDRDINETAAKIIRALGGRT